MRKRWVFLFVLIALFGFLAIAHAGLTVIRTATTEGNDYEPIHDANDYASFGNEGQKAIDETMGDPGDISYHNDQDGDEVRDEFDNCQFVENHDQLDIDADGLGDACDDDPDGDGIIEGDNCPYTSNGLQEDTDDDDIGDACDVPDITIDDLLALLYEGAGTGTIDGVGQRPWLRHLHLWAIEWMLGNADDSIEEGKTRNACTILEQSFNRCDGDPYPKDFIQGNATWELSDMIMELICSLDCKGCQ